MYWVKGELSIPKERREQMNRIVLELLDKCGIRKTETIELAGSNAKVVRKPSPDKDGIVAFDYSIFERLERKTATYDTNTCCLTAPDRGYAEFGLVMNMIMVLQILHSETVCRFMDDDAGCRIEPYLHVIFSVITFQEDGPKKRDPDSPYLLYKRFLRDNEDEFLEFWDNDDIILSPQLTGWIDKWKEDFKNGEPGPEISEQLLSKTIREICEYWGHRLVDKGFIMDFLRMRNDPDHRKAFRLIREFMDKDLALFPELTPKQAMEWMVRDNRDSKEEILLFALLSLLANHKKRREIFGF